MKKQKIANYLKLGILLFVISLLLWNCEKEEVSFETPIVKQNVVHITLEEFKNENINSTIFKDLSGNLDINKPLLNKGEKQKEKITVLTDKILKVDKNNVTTYSFILEKPTSKTSDFENLMIFKYPNDNYKLFIFKYQYTGLKEKPFKIKYKNTNAKKIKNFDFLRQLLSKDIDITLDDCVSVSYQPCSGSGDADGHTAVEGYCDGSATVLDFSACFYPDSGTGIDGIGNNNGTGDSNDSVDDYSTSGGGTNNPSGTGAVNTPPCGDSVHECGKKADIIASQLQLNSDESNWLRDQPEETIINFEIFLLENNYSDESEIFAKDYIQLSILGIDNLTNEEIESFFNFNQDYKNRMSASERIIFNNMSKFKQMGYLFNGQKATWRAENLYPNSLHNGKGDAFRHAYFNGLNAFLLGEPLAKSLATAHENKPLRYFHESKEKEMDLFNNQVGRDRVNFFQDGFNSLEESILEAMSYGLLRYLSNLEGGKSSGRATNLSELTFSNN
ncbi:MAG: hypothetical protein ACI8WA_000331 [Polaribacter sp.]|jgi:hypothetical protein